MYENNNTKPKKKDKPVPQLKRAVDRNDRGGRDDNRNDRRGGDRRGGRGG